MAIEQLTATSAPEPLPEPVTEAVPGGPQPAQEEVVAQAPEGFTEVAPSPVATPDGFTPVESDAPEGFTAVEAEEPSIFGKIKERFLGTDVDDPLEMTRIGTIIATGLTGAKVGVSVPGPAPVKAGAGFLGGVLGVAAGAGMPEGVMTVAERLEALPPGYAKEHGLSPEELKTMIEGEVLLDLATMGSLTILRGTGRATGQLFTGVGKTAKELTERAARQGIHLMPVMVGNRAVAKGYVNVMGRFPFLGTSIRKRGRAAEEQFRKAVAGIPERLRPITSWSEVSELIYKDGRKLVEKYGEYFDKQYTELFDAAEKAGVWAVPSETLKKADEIMKKIGATTPAFVSGKAKPGETVKIVADFIEKEIMPMAVAASGSRSYAKQTLLQMDGLISKIDQKIGSLEPSQKKWAADLLNQLRQSAQADVLVNLRGPGASEIAARMRAVDTEFSQVMSELFETATAKQFQSVRKKGIRGLARDEVTRIPVDMLSRSIVKLDSPQSIKELHRIIEPETFNRVVAEVMNTATQRAMVTSGENIGKFNVDVFIKHLGLEAGEAGIKGGSRRETIKSMLELSDSPLTIQMLDDIAEAGQALKGVEIPNASSFIARRASIGGLQAIINGVVPGLAFTGGGTFVGSAFLGFVTFVGGSKLLSAIVSQPNTARKLATIMDKEVSGIVRKKAWLQAIRGGIQWMSENGELPDGDMVKTKMIKLTIDGLQSLQEQYDSMGVE